MSEERKINDWWLRDPNAPKPPIVVKTQRAHLTNEQKKLHRQQSNDQHRDQINERRRAYRARKGIERGPRRKPNVRGERNSRAVISEEDVRTIRQMYANGESTQRELGAMFGLAGSTVGLIIRRKRWAHVN